MILQWFIYFNLAKYPQERTVQYKKGLQNITESSI